RGRQRAAEKGPEETVLLLGAGDCILRAAKLRQCPERNRLRPFDCKRPQGPMAPKSGKDVVFTRKDEKSPLEAKQWTSREALGAKLEFQGERESDLKNAPKAMLPNDGRRSSGIRSAQMLESKRQIIPNRFGDAPCRARVARLNPFRHQNPVAQRAELL